MKQQSFLKSQDLAYGGTLRNKRKGRGARSLSTKESMHLVLRSSLATKDWSFRKPENDQIIRHTIGHFSKKYGIQILSLANVGNHLHFHIKLNNRYTYTKWIRAITSAIAMKITGMNRWTGGKNSPSEKFWDYRPFTRVVRGFRALTYIKDYLLINRLEGWGVPRATTRIYISNRRAVS